MAKAHLESTNQTSLKKTKSRSETAKKAVDTMRRRGMPPKFDGYTAAQAEVLAHAYRAASSAVNRAKLKRRPADEKWMLECHKQIIEQEFRCAVTGREFDLKKHKTKGAGGTHMAPSPDQIDPERGYVSDNVRWVIWAVNRAKGEMPEDLFIEICRDVVRVHEAKVSST